MMVEQSTQAVLVDILTHQLKEKKERKKSRDSPPPVPPPIKEIEQATAAGIVLFNLLKEKVMEKGMVLPNVSSNNEIEYVALIGALKWCVSMIR